MGYMYVSMFFLSYSCIYQVRGSISFCYLLANRVTCFVLNHPAYALFNMIRSVPCALINF